MRKVLRFLLWTAIIVGAVIGLARLTAIRWVRIPTGDAYLEASIAPSLRGGDTVILWRLTAPKFGDLVVCPEPDAAQRIVIGRIAGEEGDKIKVEGANLTVNDRQAETETACAEKTFQVAHPGTGQQIEQTCSIEAIGGSSHKRGGTGGHGVLPPPVNLTVESGKVFLLSDNRLLPYDSRDFGLVDRSTCTESVVFRLYGSGGFFDEKHRFTFIQ